MNQTWLSNGTTSNRLKNTYIQGFLDISGNLITRSGNVFVNNGIFVVQDSSFNGNLQIANNTISSNIFAKLDASFNRDLTVGNIAKLNRLAVSTDSTFTGNIAVSGINSTISNLTISTNLTSTSNAVFNANISLAGNLSVAQNVVITNNASILGTTTLNALSMTTNISVTGNILVQKDSIFNANLTVVGNLISSSVVSLNVLNISGITTMSNKLSAQNITSTGQLSVALDSSFNSNLFVNNSISATNFISTGIIYSGVYDVSGTVMTIANSGTGKTVNIGKTGGFVNILGNIALTADSTLNVVANRLAIISPNLIVNNTGGTITSWTNLNAGLNIANGTNMNAGYVRVSNDGLGMLIKPPNSSTVYKMITGIPPTTNPANEYFYTLNNNPATITSDCSYQLGISTNIIPTNVVQCNNNTGGQTLQSITTNISIAGALTVFQDSYFNGNLYVNNYVNLSKKYWNFEKLSITAINAITAISTSSYVYIPIAKLMTVGDSILITGYIGSTSVLGQRARIDVLISTSTNGGMSVIGTYNTYNTTTMPLSAIVPSVMDIVVKQIATTPIIYYVYIQLPSASVSFDLEVSGANSMGNNSVLYEPYTNPILLTNYYRTIPSGQTTVSSFAVSNMLVSNNLGSIISGIPAIGSGSSSSTASQVSANITAQGWLNVNGLSTLNGGLTTNGTASTFNNQVNINGYFALIGGNIFRIYDSNNTYYTQYEQIGTMMKISNGGQANFNISGLSTFQGALTSVGVFTANAGIVVPIGQTITTNTIQPVTSDANMTIGGPTAASVWIQCVNSGTIKIGGGGPLMQNLSVSGSATTFYNTAQLMNSVINNGSTLILKDATNTTQTALLQTTNKLNITSNLMVTGAITADSVTSVGAITADIIVARDIRTTVISTNNISINGITTATGPINANGGINATNISVLGSINTDMIIANGINTTTLTVVNAIIANGGINVNGVITANSGINTSTLTVANAITANGSINTSTLTAANVITANGGINTSTLTAANAITANGGINCNVMQTLVGGDTIKIGSNMSTGSIGIGGIGWRIIVSNTDTTFYSTAQLKGTIINNGNTLILKDATNTTQTSLQQTTNQLNITGGVTISSSLTALSFNATSDYRIKDDIQPLSLEKTIDKLRPVQYINKLSNSLDIGLVAHEVQEYFPELVSGEKDGDENQSINYIGLIGVLIKEVQELKKEMAILRQHSIIL